MPLPPVTFDAATYADIDCHATLLIAASSRCATSPQPLLADGRQRTPLFDYAAAGYAAAIDSCRHADAAYMLLPAYTLPPPLALPAYAADTP